LFLQTVLLLHADFLIASFQLPGPVENLKEAYHHHSIYCWKVINIFLLTTDLTPPLISLKQILK
jgi:hypothetical protein